MQINEESIFKIAVEFYHFLLGKHLKERENPNLSHYQNSNKSLSNIYPAIFNEVMQIICLKMAKPEEVLIVID